MLFCLTLGRMVPLEALSVAAMLLLGGLYAWVFYNVPILIKGLRAKFEVAKDRAPMAAVDSFPRFSIIVAAKNEALVLGRLLSRLTELDYPKGRYEVLVIEDGSSDETAKVGRHYELKFPELIRFHHRDETSGKPAALNCGSSLASGEIVVIVDADNLPNRDFLRRAARYFDDPQVVALQGLTLPINENENLVTKICSYEEKAWFRPYILGKEKLGLFVPLTGSCGFIRREFLERVGGWDNKSLTEDLELSARIIEREGRIRYATDVICLQEYPSSAVQFIKQRARWTRGYTETFLTYGKALRNVNKTTIDVEFTLARPLALNLILAAYAIAVIGAVTPRIFPDPSVLILADGAAFLMAATLLLRGILILVSTKPVKIRNLIWIPLVYGYWILQAVIAARAFLQVAFGRPSSWTKTERSGGVTVTET